MNELGHIGAMKIETRIFEDYRWAGDQGSLGRSVQAGSRERGEEIGGWDAI